MAGEEDEERDAEAADEAYDAVTASESEADVPPVDFNTFVLSLSTSAAMHLGMADNPQTGDKTVDLPIARHTIDILGMLEEKTEGNLTGEEERLLSQVLYDLRMQFVARSKEQK